MWLRAEPVRDLLVLRAHLLSPRALGRLVALAQQCGLRLWLIVHRPALRPAQRRTLDQTRWQTISMAEFQRRWPAAAHQPEPHPPTGDDGGFPRCYRDTMHQVLAWLADQTPLLETMYRVGRQAADGQERVVYITFIMGNPPTSRCQAMLRCMWSPTKYVTGCATSLSSACATMMSDEQPRAGPTVRRMLLGAQLRLAWCRSRPGGPTPGASRIRAASTPVTLCGRLTTAAFTDILLARPLTFPSSRNQHVREPLAGLGRRGIALTHQTFHLHQPTWLQFNLGELL